MYCYSSSAVRFSCNIKMFFCLVIIIIIRIVVLYLYSALNVFSLVHPFLGTTQAGTRRKNDVLTSMGLNACWGCSPKGSRKRIHKLQLLAPNLSHESQFISKSIHSNISDNQLLHLCTARTVWSDPVIRPVLVRSGKFTIHMVTNENQRKLTNQQQDVSSKSIKLRSIEH